MSEVELHELRRDLLRCRIELDTLHDLKSAVERMKKDVANLQGDVVQLREHFKELASLAGLS
jgi:hypothetical protein